MQTKPVLFLICTACVVSCASAEFEDLDIDDFAEELAEKGPPPPPMPPRNVTSATAGVSGSSGVYGGLTFVTYGGNMYMQGVIANLSDGQHGIHIHATGKVWNSCKSIGDIYNPFNVCTAYHDNHNSYAIDCSIAGSEPIKKTHACNPTTGKLGDLGNVISSNGIAFVNITVPGMTLDWSNGKTGNANPGVLGLSIAVDTSVDTCQATNDGNSGPTLACGIILPLFGIPPSGGKQP